MNDSAIFRKTSLDFFTSILLGTGFVSEIANWIHLPSYKSENIYSLFQTYLHLSQKIIIIFLNI